jgi:sigma-B regulation protein RsbU (phosphoserine phosphatase)
MAKQLKKQLTEITDLSEKTIRQEKEKKQILENQNIELEKKVIERTSEVVQQKEVIEIKNKEITDNLTYAKRIQSAILPDIKLIYKALEQSFILYLPKDIVSGDFYGFAQKNNKVLIAAADCTGHGVAGAFMSMIGSALLNQIINEKNITTPSFILDELNDGIIHSLKQKESDSNDGMDISICSFDLEKKTMEFAGANRPLWLIRNNQLLVFKPNKFPIGGLQILHDEKFKQDEIKLQMNDSIYIFSDGYSDQFGGEKGKKLMSGKFKELLLSIQNLSMHDQEKYLYHHFQKWKMNNEQVDDVLVIGIRI